MTGLLAPQEESAAEEPSLEHEQLRDLVIRAHPDVIPELIQGETIAELLISVEPARAAYQRLLESIPVEPTAPPVPAGGNPAAGIDLEQLPPTEKIRRALEQSAAR